MTFGLLYVNVNYLDHFFKGFSLEPTVFLFFAFGANLTNHSMAYFSILTLKKFAPANSKYVMYTDRPDFYKYLSPIVETRLLDEKTLKDWHGPHNFVWRVKIMAMLDSAQKDRGHLVYLDTDTFALESLTPMIEKLQNGANMMHESESLLSEDRAKNKMLMWKQTQNKTFGGMTITSQTAMWNAGVVALNAKDKLELLNKALQSTDEMCEQKVERWLIEQLSISLSLASSKTLIPAAPWMAHYWGNKDGMLRNIQIFLTQLLQQSINPLDALNLINISEWKTHLIRPTKKSFLKKWLRF